jgi:hypothetical protein
MIQSESDPLPRSQIFQQNRVLYYSDSSKSCFWTLRFSPARLALDSYSPEENRSAWVGVSGELVPPHLGCTLAQVR